jgi:hypothetical protein
MPITFSAPEDLAALLALTRLRSAGRSLPTRVCWAPMEPDYPEVSGPAPTWIAN